MAKRNKDNEDQPGENQGNADDSADNFGLPDIEYKPLDREQETTQDPPLETASETESYSSGGSGGEGSQDYEYDDEESPSRAPLIISLIIGLVIIAAGFLLYKYVYVPKQAEKERLEQLAKEKEIQDKKAEEARLAKEEEDRKRAEAEAALKAKPAEGSIETLSGRTRRYYVVVTSNVDDDLLMDYARKLSAKGVSSKVIPPFGNVKFFRLAIADFDSFSAAQSSADASKADYGPALWVIRY